MAFDYTQFLARFVEEAKEHCARMNDGLLKLESSAAEPELLNDLFRAAHSIKGSARMMKLAGITELAHRLEDLLDLIRSGGVKVTGPHSDLLFKGVDALAAMLEEVAAGRTTPEAPAPLCEALSLAAAGAGSPAPPPPVEAVAPRLENHDQAAGAFEHKISDYLRVNAGKLDELIKLMGEIVSGHGKLKSQLGRLEPSSELRGIYETFRFQEQLVTDLRNTALKLRMQPLSAIFEPLRRTVRDLARERGREIDFIVEGGETELDRKIIERIGDSLTHMIRNALDHGLESPEERAAAGKPPRGVVRLLAEYDSTGVSITLEDDGKGIKVEKIREKALGKRLYDADTLAAMSRAEIVNLIFLPGFSTSPIITDLSGRGVGMDVVRKNIVDELRGSVIVESEEGRGTSIVLRLPLNLAVFSLFLVEVKGRVFALPATALAEMLNLQRRDIIEIVNYRAIRLRNQLIPLEELADILALGGRDPDNEGQNQQQREQLPLVIVRDGEEKLGLLVDRIIGREEMVVKPLPAHLRGLRLLSGLTIGERDRIINVLHIPELIRRARQGVTPVIRSEAAEEKERHGILVVDDSLNTRELVKSILESYGYLVDTAEDGEEAMAKVRETLYDLVITDIEMPRLDGFSLTERLRADERYREVPIIIVTSREKEEDKRRGIRVGADAYIVKSSFDQTNLLETVQGLL